MASQFGSNSMTSRRREGVFRGRRAGSESGNAACANARAPDKLIASCRSARTQKRGTCLCRLILARRARRQGLRAGLRPVLASAVGGPDGLRCGVRLRTRAIPPEFKTESRP